jgi:hypothetical protein
MKPSRPRRYRQKSKLTLALIYFLFLMSIGDMLELQMKPAGFRCREATTLPLSNRRIIRTTLLELAGPPRARAAEFSTLASQEPGQRLTSGVFWKSP